MAPVAYAQSYATELATLTPGEAVDFASTWLTIGLVMFIPPLWKGVSEIVLLQPFRLCLTTGKGSTFEKVEMYLKLFNSLALTWVSGVTALILSLTWLNGKNSQSQVDWATLAGLFIAEQPCQNILAIGKEIRERAGGASSREAALISAGDFARTALAIVRLLFALNLYSFVPDAENLHQFFQFGAFLLALGGLVSEINYENGAQSSIQFFTEFAGVVIIFAGILMVYVAGPLPSYFLPYSAVNYNTPFLILTWTVSILVFAYAGIVLLVHHVWPKIAQRFKEVGLASTVGTLGATGTTYYGARASSASRYSAGV